jgi:DNA-directed RNA polymerase subunit F
MANRRNLKRSINYICSELIAECVAASLYNGNIDKENADTLLTSILKMQSDYISRVSHTEPTDAKKYYKNLIQSFNKQTDEIIDQISNIF